MWRDAQECKVVEKVGGMESLKLKLKLQAGKE